MRLAWLADHDSLTGLYNRRRFEQELKDAIASAKRYQYTGALLIFDLDQFKYVKTPAAMRQPMAYWSVSNQIPQVLREVDIIGRLGGDEFGVILSDANATDATQVAKKRSINQ